MQPKNNHTFKNGRWGLINFKTLCLRLEAENEAFRGLYIRVRVSLRRG